jgi:hypothetical protein
MDIFVVKDCFGNNHKVFNNIQDAFNYRHKKQNDMNASKEYLGRVQLFIDEMKIESK